MIRHVVAAAVLATLAFATIGRANESSAEFATGGLRFKTDADIAMRAEDLSISMERVRVAYSFFNRARADTTSAGSARPDSRSSTPTSRRPATSSS